MCLLGLVNLPATSIAHEGHGSHDEGDRDPQAIDVREADEDWWHGTDLLVEGRPGVGGYTVFVRLEREAYVARPIATIQPLGNAEDDWLGSLCVTGDGKHAIVNVAQRGAVNDARMRDRGGLLYDVALPSGAVTPLASGVAFKFHAVGCGARDEVAYVRHLGSDQEASEVFVARVGRPFSRVASSRGQLVNPVPTARGVMALRGGTVVRLSAGSEQVEARPQGEPFALRANGQGSVDLLVLRDKNVSVARVEGKQVRVLATGPVGEVKLAMGRSGRTFSVGAAARSAGKGFTALAGDPQGFDGLSHEGRLVARSSTGRTYAWAATDRVLAVNDAAGLGPTTRAVAGVAGSGTASRTAGSAALAGEATPVCAVPRNASNRQAYASLAVQNDWAVQQAVRGLLQGSNARPANYLNSGLAAYSPSIDFPVPTPVGNANWRFVPPAVMNGVLAQESAYRHASRRVLPGNGGNPNISDYYGAEGTLDKIDYSQSDCGYGVSQVTTGMRTSDSTPDAAAKAKVAIDYAENISAGARILAQKWNQLQAAGIVLNNGDPQYIENWYTALWAYNSGVQPSAAYGNTTGCTPGPSCTDSHGHWGLGWTNNPANPDYPADRRVFLEVTYADAERPGDWPYQERVLGWAVTPIFDYTGEPSYDGAMDVVYPYRFAFCRPSNSCDPNLVNPSDPSLSYCTRVDNHCWFHESVMDLDCAASPSPCNISLFSVDPSAPEPAKVNPWPPACNNDLGTGAIIVDELSNPAENLFCPTRNWSNKGTFSYTVGSKVGTDGTTQPLGIIDFHQVATGFGGHAYFTGNRFASDPYHQVTGTWTPTLSTTAKPYVVKVHIPRQGSSTGSATYKITKSDGTVASRTIDTHEHFNHWKSLGVYQLKSGSKVTLSNVTGEVKSGVATVPFDAMAFIPAPGTLKSTTVEAVAYFDENTNIDSKNDPAGWFFNSPLESRGELYEWAHDVTSRVLAHPACADGHIGSDCIKPLTRAAFARWSTEVEAAGATNAVTKWMALANSASYRPTTNAITPAFRTDDGAYKIRSKVKVSFVVNLGAIVSGTEDIEVTNRTSDTHMPRFLLDIMQALETEYGDVVPDLSYNQVDLNVYDHQTRSTSPNTTNAFPGQAEPWVLKPPPYRSGTCVHAVYTSGGSIGYRSMLATEYVPNRVEAWKEEVGRGDGMYYPEETLDKFANDVFDMFFHKRSLAPGGSPFNQAPPIWEELNFKYCANGTVTAGESGYPILRASWMPNQYLYRDGKAITQTGAAKTTATPIMTGDFKGFTDAPLPDGGGPYGGCHYSSGRAGNPWGITVPAYTDSHSDIGHICWNPLYNNQE